MLSLDQLADQLGIDETQIHGGEGRIAIGPEAIHGSLGSAVENGLDVVLQAFATEEVSVTAGDAVADGEIGEAAAAFKVVSNYGRRAWRTAVPERKMDDEK